MKVNKHSPLYFIEKILDEINGIPNSSWIFFSNESYSGICQLIPESLKYQLQKKAFRFVDLHPYRFELKLYEGIDKNVPIQLTKLNLKEECMAIFLNIDSYKNFKPAEDWLQRLNKFWVMENKEALFYQESGFIFGYKIDTKFSFNFFALEEHKAKEVLDHFKSAQ